jgi:hypothetical protein
MTFSWDFIMTRAQIDRETAIDYLVQTLRAEKAACPDFPQLSEGAMRALAIDVVKRNGTSNHQLNEQDVFAALRTGRHRWEYFGVMGMLRAIYHKIFITTEKVP